MTCCLNLYMQAWILPKIARVFGLSYSTGDYTVISLQPAIIIAVVPKQDLAKLVRIIAGLLIKARPSGAARETAGCRVLLGQRFACRWLKRTRLPALQTLFTNFYSARCLCLAPEAQLIHYPYSTVTLVYGDWRLCSICS